MFQDGSDGGPTDSPQTLGARVTGDVPCARTAERSGHTLHESAQVELTERGWAPEPSERRLAPLWGIPRSPGRPAPSRSITLPSPQGTEKPPSREASTARQPVVALSPQKVHRTQGVNRAGRGRHHSTSQILTPAPREPAEFRGSTLWSHPFASERFHVLLNSLFKVLFNFPSRYLCAIGLVPIFSLRWSLPPALGCILKQPDSGDESTRDGRRASQRPNTRSGQGPNQENSDASEAAPSAVPNTTGPAGRGAGGFGAGLLPVHSPLLGESWLVSFPPLTNMLKFSG